jgi:serine/threonine protein kinase/tetratricopeptide (TPR) repeat protein
MTIEDAAKSIFLAALERPADDWAGFLDQACEANSELRARAEALLNAHRELGSIHNDAGAMVTAYEPTITERPGTVIGPYKLLEQIGEGGFGVVFMAEQTRPIRRRVAIKVLKPGMDTRQVVARFEAERQALAIMDHPNIARVFDGGATPSGRPFFVMELVKGMPITEFCDANHLTTRQRLELFIPICQAVQHSHQKGIVHRDLKPSNVLVTMHDTVPVPKVIDFGVAKAQGQELTEKTLFTAFAQMIGTPLYMSPEQAGQSGLDVDTRSDVYSLGVLLYELLTGTTPFAKERFKKAACDEIRRIIREEEPPRPSTRLSESKAALPSISAQRHTEPAKLTKLVRGELDWIVMKALEKDRNRRYETANGFAQDVSRYLANEPVLACPPTISYRIQKFIRRNRRAVATAAAIAMALIVLVAGAAGNIGWNMRDQEARRAKLAGQFDAILAEVELHGSEKRWPDALSAARRAEALLTGAGGDAQMESQLRQMLADLELVARLEGTRYSVTGTWAGNVLVGRIDKAYATAFRRGGIDVDNLSTAEAVTLLRGRKQTLPALVAALDDWAIYRRRSENVAGADALWALAQQADPDPWRRKVREATAAKDLAALEQLAASPNLDAQPAMTWSLFGRALDSLKNRHRAIEVLRRAYERYPSDYRITSDLGLYLSSGGTAEQEEALGFGRAAVALRPQSAESWDRLAGVYFLKHRFADAVPCARRAVELEPGETSYLINLGNNLRMINGLDEEGIVYLRKAVALEPTFGWAHSSLGSALNDQKKWDEALASHRTAVELAPREAWSHYNYGAALATQGKWKEANAALAKALELDPNNHGALSNSGLVAVKQDRVDEGIAFYRKAIAIAPQFASYHFFLSDALLLKKQTNEALDELRTAVKLNPRYVAAHQSLTWVLCTTEDVKLHDYAAALRHARKAVELSPNERNSWSNLGVALLRSGSAKEAVAALEKAVQMSKSADRRHRFFLAMAYQEINEKDKARRAFDEGVEWLKSKPDQRKAEFIPFRDEAAKALNVVADGGK